MRNIIFLVWDACRADYASEYAPNLKSLAGNNLEFTNAVSPATWTLPSHASLFSGVPPDVHGVRKAGQPIEDSSLLEALTEQGYDTYGTSANTFVSQSHKFDRGFDEFEFTQFLASLEGVNPADVYRELRDVKQNDDRNTIIGTVSTCWKKLMTLISREYRVISTVKNFGYASAITLSSYHDVFNRLLPPLVHQAGIDSSRLNTEYIERVIEGHSDSDLPFFVFANYTDTHYPYTPPDDTQQEVLGESLSRCEIESINEEFAFEWSFLKKSLSDAVPEDKLERVRQMYACEVRSSDKHLGRIVENLEKHNLRDETLIIVTADHGECLGEPDPVDGPRMGHLVTVNDSVTHVPLVVSGPDVGARTVTDQVPLEQIGDLILEWADGSFDDLSRTMLPKDDYVACFATPNGVPSLYEDYPEIPNSILRKEVNEYRLAVYRGDWKLVLSTHDDDIALKNDMVVPLEEAPIELREVSASRLESVSTTEINSDTPGSETRSQLEQLGYL